ncbi:MAG: DUF86 domain-containing protein [Planctomycetes bacterium]|nr:DUF86 domain-containing protein [Planctomycetota bacterium]MBM4078071.1 DUF86 domain-containing protein [Planctomycetota bacterium]
MHPDVTYLMDILQAARLVQDFVKGVSRESFLQDVMRQSAVIRQLEIVGETGKGGLAVSFSWRSWRLGG